MGTIEIGWIDIAMLVVLVLSIVVGLARGFTFEVLSLAGWFVAWFAALWLGPWLAESIHVGDTGSALNRVLAYACVFVVALILCGFAARAAASLIGASPLRPVDRLFGAAFGAARAALLLLVVVTVVRFSPLANAPAWRASHAAVAADALLDRLLPFVAPAPAPARPPQSV